MILGDQHILINTFNLTVLQDFNSNRQQTSTQPLIHVLALGDQRCENNFEHNKRYHEWGF
jgi:hypothetical protein